MALKLYGSSISTCSQRVMLVMNELNIPYDLVDIDMMKGEHKVIFTARPSVDVPALEVDSLRIFESKAISRYLVAKYAPPKSTLGLPKTSEDLALFEQAASVEYSYFEPSIFKLAYEKLFKKMMGHGEPDAVAKLRRVEVEERADRISSKEVSLVDLFHVPWLEFLPRLDMEGEVQSRSNVRRWWERLQQRASWQKILSDFVL
ncbi:hypothetical protein E4T50_09115 [Aureobasidium sp. EXF-12298]|nr:hypothetical protein E4T50_09115 [Aureobasidium sp. EXF-12298]KAI4758118.1 hypothetical protein E4T51_08836 [Aureobasidium sp. EXF-12344]